MFACLHLPDFPLQARLCSRPGWRWEPVGVLDGFAEQGEESGKSRVPRLIALTRSAAETGVELGMTAAQAKARCGHLQIIPRHREEEAAAHDHLLRAAARIAADFEHTAPGLVTVDLGPVSSLDREGACERLGHQWSAEFADEELRLQVGFAPNPDLAALAARIADPVRVFCGESDRLRESLSPLPLDLLDPPPDYRAILTLWGIRTLGEFAELPRDEIAERLGPEAAELWDRATGRHRRLLHLVRAGYDFSVQVDLDHDHELTTLEPLMFLLRRSLDTLAARLAATYLAASEMRLRLAFTDGGGSEQVIRVPDPSRDVDRLFRLLHTRLEDVTVSRPIEGYRLECLASRPGEQPFHLFETALRDPNRFAETLAQVEALVGSDNVGSPEVLDTHRPDAIALRPFAADPGEDQALTSKLPAVQGLPLRRFRPPLPIELATGRDPVSGRVAPAEILGGRIRGRLRRLAGPWKLSGDWWEKASHWRREEWDIQLDDDSLYRIACAWETRAGADDPVPVWYLEGIYG